MLFTSESRRRIALSRFAAPLAVAVALLVFIGNEVVYHSVRQILAEREAAQSASSAVLRVRRLLAQAESAQRGYLLTQREPYKEPYTRGVGELAQAMEDLRTLAATDREMAEPLERLAELAQRKLSELREVIRLVEVGDRDNALSLVMTDIGREQMVAIDALVQRIAAAETAEAAAAGAQRDRVLLWNRLGIAVLVLFALGAVFAGLRVARAREAERVQYLQALHAERDKLETEVAYRTRELTEVATHLQTVREDERSRLARELHDELGGLMTAAKLDLARVKSRLAPLAAATPEVGERIVHLARTLDAGIALKRRIIEDLRPSSLSNLGLKAALEILCAEFARRSDIAVDAEIEELVLDEEQSLSIYRLVQEALTNVAKYAGAKRVQVQLRQRPRGGALVCVADDGRGFEPESQATGHGLAGMRFRVRSGGGTMAIRSAPGSGTTIEALLPQR